MRKAIIGIVAALVMGACSTATMPTSQALTATTLSTTTTAATTTAAVTTTTAGDSFPLIVSAANGDVVIPSTPGAIVSLSPTATEMLFAIDAGSQVVAVDDQSNYPTSAPATDLTGLSPNVEAIVAYDPDLVVISFDPGDVVDSLDALGIPVLLEQAPTSLDDVYDQIDQLGAATGHTPQAEHLTKTMQQEIEQTTLDAGPASGEPLTYYFELDPTYYTVTSSTFIGRLLALLDLQNIADAADPDGFGYPQLSSEYIIDADPDLVLLADTVCCGQDADTVASRPGWDALRAVTEGNIVVLNDDVASRWGPRIVDLLRSVAEAVREVRHQ
jgi:iron complex transport system substrate-binding protein